MAASSTPSLAVAALCISMITASCAPENARTDDTAAECQQHARKTLTLDQWYEEADDIIRRNSLSAPVSARIYAYLSLAADATHTRDGKLHVDFTPTTLRPAAADIPDPNVAFSVAASLLLAELVPAPGSTLRLEELRQNAMDPCIPGALESASAGMDVARAVAELHRFDHYTAVLLLPEWQPDERPERGWVPGTITAQAPVEPHWGELLWLGAGTPRCRIPSPSEDIAETSRAVKELIRRGDEDEAVAARFWDDPDGITSGPAGHWVRIALQETAGRPDWERAAILRELTTVIHDANIVVWRAKYRYTVPRPSQYGALPLIPDPAHPEYPSAHAAVSTAAAEVLTRAGVGSFTDTAQGITRAFASPNDAAEEAGMSRVWAGIHREESIRAGADAGRCIAGASHPE